MEKEHFIVGDEFSIPLGLEPDLEKSGGEDDNKYYIKLLAGDNAKDIQGEIVEPEGFMLDYLMKGGYFNYDHKPGSENLIGEPTDYEFVKDLSKGYCGLLVKGFLYKSKPVARHIIEHVRTLKEVGSKRRLGASVEGKRIESNGNRIVKAFIKNIAITEHPINRNTWVDIIKSFAGVCQENATKKCSKDCQHCTCTDIEKAMQTGSDITPTAGGNVLRRQSIDGEAKVTAYTDEDIAAVSVEALKLLDGSTYMDDVTGDLCNHQTNNPFLNLKKLKQHLMECRGMSGALADEIIKYLGDKEKKEEMFSLYTLLT